MRKSILLVLGIAMAALLAFPSMAGAQESSESVDADTPYIDEYGNFDSELAKEYAEIVDTYSEDGVEWELWLDEIAGTMWSEPKGGAATSDLVILWFTPDWVYVYRSGSCVLS